MHSWYFNSAQQIPCCYHCSATIQSDYGSFTSIQEELWLMNNAKIKSETSVSITQLFNAITQSFLIQKPERHAPCLRANTGHGQGDHRRTTLIFLPIWILEAMKIDLFQNQSVSLFTCFSYTVQGQHTGCLSSFKASTTYQTMQRILMVPITNI